LVWLRHDLQTMNKRLKALEADGPGESHPHLAALEKAKTEKEAHGEFESEHPGYCGADRQLKCYLTHTPQTRVLRVRREALRGFKC
jgi:hypothetical protein